MPASNLDIRFLVEPLPPLETLEREWRRFDKLGGHSFFATWSWIGTWLQSRAPSPETKLLRVLNGSATIGLSLLTMKQGRRPLSGVQAWLNSSGEPDFDCITIEHNGFASNLPRPSELWPSLSNWFASEKTEFSELVLPGVYDDAPAAGGDGLIILDRVERGYRVPLLEISSGQGVWPLLSRNSRQQLRRSMRAFERHGPLSLQAADDGPSALKFFAEMKDLHVRSWTRRGLRHSFVNPFFETFHRELILNGIAENSVDLLRISAGERALGYLYNFRRNKSVCSYQSGFDDSVAGERPGYVCHALAISHYAAESMHHYDFLGKGNQLKQSYGIEHYDLHWRRFRRPTLRYRTEALARSLMSRSRKRAPNS